MTRTFINPEGLLSTPTYSHAVRVGNTIYCAGVVGLDKMARSSPDPATQIEKAYENLRVLIEDAGARMEEIVLSRVYLTRTEHIETHRAIRSRYITSPATPYTQLIVKALGREDLICEIETIVVLEE
jgi:enamine deaminase RidA (YjgF/YER057c/UK114 family)